MSAPRGLLWAVRDFLQGCPLLDFDPDHPFQCGVLTETTPPGAAPLRLVLESAPCQPLVLPCLDGGGEYQFLFSLSVLAPVQEGLLERLDNLDLFDSFSSWLEEQTSQNHSPDLGPGKVPLSISALSSGFPLNPAGTAPRYQILGRLSYLKIKSSEQTCCL